MTWTFGEIIERASYGVTLYPGDVIGSGTVGTGCLLELNGSRVTNNLWVKEGDTVVCAIEGLGELTNTVKECYRTDMRHTTQWLLACAATLIAGGCSKTEYPGLGNEDSLLVTTLKQTWDTAHPQPGMGAALMD